MVKDFYFSYLQDFDRADFENEESSIIIRHRRLILEEWIQRKLSVSVCSSGRFEEVFRDMKRGSFFFDEGDGKH